MERERERERERVMPVGFGMGRRWRRMRGRLSNTPMTMNMIILRSLYLQRQNVFYNTTTECKACMNIKSHSNKFIKCLF